MSCSSATLPRSLNGEFMAANSSFDVTSPVDFQEVDNALNQARKEVVQRYDFKGSKADIQFNRHDGSLTLVADDEFKMNALWEIVQGRMVKRGVPVKNLTLGELERGAQDAREVRGLGAGEHAAIAEHGAAGERAGWVHGQHGNRNRPDVGRDLRGLRIFQAQRQQRAQYATTIHWEGWDQVESSQQQVGIRQVRQQPTPTDSPE